MENLFNIMVVVAVLAVVTFVMKPQYDFFVRVRRGLPELKQGRVTGEFLQNVAEVCDRHGVRDGWIAGVRQGKRVSLIFSRSLPPACQQQLRNLWTNRRA